MKLEEMYGRPDFDTPAIRAGAVEFVVCPTCGVAAGEACQFRPGNPIRDWAHIGRRFEYVDGRGLLYGEPTHVAPDLWVQCKGGRHAECLPHPANCQCGYPPRPCECECHKKSNSDVDDLLG